MFDHTLTQAEIDQLPAAFGVTAPG